MDKVRHKIFPNWIKVFVFKKINCACEASQVSHILIQTIKREGQTKCYHSSKQLLTSIFDTVIRSISADLCGIGHNANIYGTIILICISKQTIKVFEMLIRYDNIFLCIIYRDVILDL